MNTRKKVLAAAVTVALGGVSMGAQANLTSGAALSFEPGIPVTTGCIAGNWTGTSCTIGGTAIPEFEITDIGGSYFALEINGIGGVQAEEKIAISQFAPLDIGRPQISSGQHTSPVNGSESPAIDNAWNFFFNTGMHTLTSPISVISDFGATKTLDFSGWGVNWGNFGPGGTQSTIPVGGTATIICGTDCSISDTYILDMDVHIPVAFASVPYSLHLEGTVAPPGVLPPSIAINISGGTVQECDITNGNDISMSASVFTPEPGDVASITWYLDDNLAGEGEDLDIFVPLGSHTIKAILETTQSGTAESVATILVRDTVDPQINAAFVSLKNGIPVTEITGSGDEKVRIAAEVSDDCDPQPAVSMTIGSPAQIDDVLIINTSKKKPTLEISSATVQDSIELKATAEDASGNDDSKTVTLTIAP